MNEENVVKKPPRKTAAKKTVAETVKEKEAIKAPTFKDDDMILCMSYIPGKLCLSGKRTGNLYVWEKMGDEEAIQYVDLKAEINSPKSQTVYNPNVIILNKDVYANNQKIKDLYASLYDMNEIVKILSANNVEEVRLLLESSDEARIRAIKTLASDLIADGRLNNIRVIQTIDNVLGTDFRMSVLR